MFLLLIIVIVSTVLIAGGRKTLWPLFHLLGVLLGLPGFLFASACLVMQRATSHSNLLDFFDTILSFVVAMYPWGIAVTVVCLLILLAAGFGARWRRAAAAVVTVMALGSAAVIHWVAGLPEEAGQWWFFAPGALSALIAGVLFVTAKSSSREFTFQYPQGPRIGRGLFVGALRSLEGQPGFHRRQAGAAGWVWYTLPSFQDDSTRMGVELGFQDGVLQQISLFHDEPTLYGVSREDGPANKEQLRAENTRAWLQAKGFRVGSYPWGEVWASYDPRSDFGSVGIRYAPSPKSLTNPSVSVEVSNRLRVESPDAV